MRAPSALGLFLLFLSGSSVGAAEAGQGGTGTVRVEVLDAGIPVADVRVLSGTESASTDAAGVALLTLPAGSHRVVADKAGYETFVAGIDVVAGQTHRVQVTLTPTPGTREDPAVVASTRVPRRLDEQPVPIDVLGRTAIDQQAMMTPGDISRMLGGLPGLRPRVTSPELGLTMMRLRGSRGHHTRLLSDGVVLDFDRPGGLAFTQMSPLDLAQVEVLTDGASAIFGANALSGAVNLVSRRPGLEPEREILFSQSASGGTDGLLWLSLPPSGSWSSTWLVGGHRQDERDVDDDGWSDFARESRGVFRTRVLWDNRQGRFASGTAGVTFEKREGGSATERQQLETKEADGALFGQMPLGNFILSGAGTLFVQSRIRDFSDRREHERRQSATFELALRGGSGRHAWLAGLEADWFANRAPSGPLPSAIVYTGPGIFVHDEMQVTPWLSVSGGARVDVHVDDGASFSPRGAVLVHGGAWAARVSAGRNYAAPTPLTEETEAAGVAFLAIDGDLERETLTSVTADLTHTTRRSVFSVSVFRTEIDNPALVDRETFTLFTDDDPVVTNGVEVLGTVRGSWLALGGTYAFLQARERGGVDVALTPRHGGTVVATVGNEQQGRVSLQVRATGEQRLDRNPYRTTSEPYTLVDLFGDWPIGRLRLFVNGENLTDVRQTDWDPIARPLPDVDGRSLVDVWAPIRGRVVNAGVRISF